MGKRLRVLMYHGISDRGEKDELTVDLSQLSAHFRHLNEAGYSSILLSDLIASLQGHIPLPPKPVLVTFDDGFRDNYELAYPLAKEYGIRINFFVVPAFIRRGEYRGRPCMNEDELRSLDPRYAEIGLHSFEHQSYSQMTPVKMAQDIEDSRHALDEMGIPYQPALAYPYGAYPKRKGHLQDRLFEILEEQGIALAFRIGNRVNPLPLRNKSLIQRIDITGLDSQPAFEWSLSHGKKHIRWAAPFLRRESPTATRPAGNV